MDLTDLQRHWHAFGEQDPFWAILTDPARKGGRWDVDEFFATGRAEIAALMAEARRVGLPRQARRALDFGCGVGRLTQALAGHADEVLGLDVAPSMVEKARTLNRHGARVQYAVQAAPPLASIADGSVDLVYTGRVLQHIAPEYSRQYIAELARVLAPGGFLSFDVPGRWLDTPAMPAGALAPSAYRARLDVQPRSGGADGTLVLDVTVTNAGDAPWPAGAEINLGNHWLSRDGAVVVADDRRVPVPRPLAPGASVTIAFATPPAEDPAATVLELDLVHEGVAWFAWQGSPTVRLARGDGGLLPAPSRPADLPAGPTGAPASAAGFEPVMEMHAVPRAEVEQILAAAGVRLLQVRPETHCGPHWEAWRYDVTAGAGR